MVEIWKYVFNSQYQISNLGRVRNKNTGSILIPYLNPNGYYSIELCGSINHKFRLHRLIAQIFIPNPLHLPEVNHIDGNKLNNRVDNLEWVTSKQNSQHALQHGHWRHQPVKASNGKTYFSLHDAERDTGINSGSISAVCRGKYRQYKGLVFQYAEDSV